MVVSQFSVGKHGATLCSGRGSCRPASRRSLRPYFRWCLRLLLGRRLYSGDRRKGCFGSNRPGSLQLCSLTPAWPVRTLFPNGVTFYAPDYSRSAQFRLTFRSGLLLAFYFDRGGVSRTLVYDKARKAWSQDVYADQMRVGYAIEQPQSSFQSHGNLYPGIVLGRRRRKGLDGQGSDQRRGRADPWRRGYAANITPATPERMITGETSFSTCLAPAGMNATPVTLRTARGPDYGNPRQYGPTVYSGLRRR